MSEDSKSKLPIHSTEECSEEFYRSLCDSGSNRIRCDACDREHFSPIGDFEPGELEGLRISASSNPDGCIQHDDFVSWGYFLGKQIVAECLCGYAAKAEKTLWAHRGMILSYFKARSVRDLENVQANADEVMTAVDAMKGEDGDR